jgi:sulfofructose kinase
VSSRAEAAGPVVLCAGIAVIDHVFLVEHFPEPGTKTRARDFTAVVGGCAANAAVAAARLGGHARLACPLGGPAERDTIGDEILARLKLENIDCSAVVRAESGYSPISAIFVDATGERLIVNRRDEALNALRIPDPERLVSDIDTLMIDNRFPDFVLPIAAAARRRDGIVVMDADDPTQRTDELLASCTHIVFSAEGLRATARLHDLGAALREVARRTPAFLAVTDGPRGMLWIDKGELHRAPAFAVNAVDTLGAGDVFHGAFAVALAEGRSIPDALRFSAAAAAVKCTRFGGIAGAPIRAEVEAFLEALP